MCSEDNNEDDMFVVIFCYVIRCDQRIMMDTNVMGFLNSITAILNLEFIHAFLLNIY